MKGWSNNKPVEKVIITLLIPAFLLLVNNNHQRPHAFVY